MVQVVLVGITGPGKYAEPGAGSVGGLGRFPPGAQTKSPLSARFLTRKHQPCTLQTMSSGDTPTTSDGPEAVRPSGCADCSPATVLAPGRGPGRAGYTLLGVVLLALSLMTAACSSSTPSSGGPAPQEALRRRPHRLRPPRRFPLPRRPPQRRIPRPPCGRSSNPGPFPPPGTERWEPLWATASSSSGA